MRGVEFVVLTTGIWMEAIRQFAGESADRRLARATTDKGHSRRVRCKRRRSKGALHATDSRSGSRK